MSEPPPHNPLKLPFFALCAALGALAAVVGVIYGAWWLAALGVAEIIGCALVIRVIRRGDNPRWLLAPLDRRWPR